MRVCVCGSQVPFVTGGAEALTGALVDGLTSAGHSADSVDLPFSWSPRIHLLNSALAWRLVSLDADGHPPDLAIATRFPSYLVRHPNKVIWLIHQFRQVYDLLGTRFSDFGDSAEDLAMIEKLRAMDRRGFREARQVYAISHNVANRLQSSLGIEAQVLYPPPRLADRLEPGPIGNYVFTASRLDELKRVELLIEAVALSNHGLRARIAL